MPATFTTYYQSPVGLLRLSGTEHYLSELHFVDNEEDAGQPASTELPPLAIQVTEQLIEYFQGHRRTFEIPVNQEGTEFQLRVWSELMHIPYGKTSSYQDMARRLGDLKTIRAAASANGRNNVAIIVPCHRVIGTNGELVGYAGGLWRKKWLLGLENRVANGVQTLF
ncbi:MAG TPA: methylated-DNA--[protein]-cysteine S-methyltransferase [Pseudobacter sp.]|nr:methylated-DNA--[protein]-cysteine S-methyltransferase [Pseudobacter sp.]